MNIAIINKIFKYFSKSGEPIEKVKKVKRKTDCRIRQYIPEDPDSLYVIEYRNGSTIWCWEPLPKWDDRRKEWRIQLVTWCGINAYWRYFVENLTDEKFEKYMNEQYRMENIHKEDTENRRTRIIAHN